MGDPSARVFEVTTTTKEATSHKPAPVFSRRCRDKVRFKQPVAVVPQISQRPTADRAFLVYFAALADDPQADEAGRSAGGRFEAEPAVAMMGGSSAGGAVTVKRRGVEVVRERHGASPHRLCLFVPHGGAEEGGGGGVWSGGSVGRKRRQGLRSGPCLSPVLFLLRRVFY